MAVGPDYPTPYNGMAERKIGNVIEGFNKEGRSEAEALALLKSTIDQMD